MLTIIATISIIAQVILSLFVYINNPKRSVNRVFSLLSIALSVWAALNFANSLPGLRDNLVLMRFIMFFVVIQNFLFAAFSKSLRQDKFTINRKEKIYGLLSVVISLITLSPFFFIKVAYGKQGPYPVPGPGMLLFIIHAFGSIFYGFRSIIHAYKATPKGLKPQLRYISAGSIVLWGFVPLTNFVLSLTTKTSFFIQFSPIYTLLFSSIIVYAIVSQRLFDVRSAVARSVTYILMLGSISLAYSLIVFGVINVLLSDPSQETVRNVLPIIIITPLMLSFQKIKLFFDRVTHKIFYRDSYDTQVVLDKLGNRLVNEIDLDKILNNIHGLLGEVLKSSFLEFILVNQDRLLIKNPASKWSHEDIRKLVNYLRNQHKDLVITDELGQNSQTRQLLLSIGVAMGLKLQTKHQTVGYIIFGHKKSGDIYSEQDKRLLMTASSELAIAIQNALRFEEIQQFNATLQNKVNDQTLRLRQANEKLKKLDEAKDDFISIASHQLRTPLTAIAGYSSMLIEGYAGRPLNKTENEFISQIFNSSKRMNSTIADLLNLSRLKTGKFVIEPEEFNLVELIDEEIKQTQEMADNRQVKLIFKKPDSFPVVTIDKAKITQVIMNFIDNAIYYTDENGQVTIDLEETSKEILFKVTDTGIGVPSNQRSHLFGKFFRADNAKRARPDGTGIGLYMAKKAIEAQGGKIIFESSINIGSTFGFSFSKKVLEGLQLNSAPPEKSTKDTTTVARSNTQ